MLYAQVQPVGITGIAALAPYLGTRETSVDILASGGLRRWQAPAGPLDPDDLDSRLWRWLKPFAEPFAAAERAPADRPQLYLGYGRSDRFAYSNDLLAAALPPGHVVTTDGGHDWGPWLAQWQGLLDAMPLVRDAGCRVDASGLGTAAPAADPSLPSKRGVWRQVVRVGRRWAAPLNAGSGRRLRGAVLRRAAGR